MLKLLLIALGGALGTLARYGTGTLLRSVTERTAFPYGTLAVNLLGCLIIGYLQGLFADRWLVREEYRVAMLVGILGGFTTFSSYGWETTAMMQDGQMLRAGMNLLANNVLGIGLVMVGYALSRLT